MSARERRRGRRAALQILYSREVGGIELEAALAAYPAIEGAERSAGSLVFAERIVRGTIGDLETIDSLIAARAEHWRLSRMAVVDRLILRMAVYELLHEPDTPARVVIDEAIELARAFSGAAAAPFVNGVLDAIRKARETV